MQRALFYYTGMMEHPQLSKIDDRIPPIDRSLIRGDIPPPVNVMDLAALANSAAPPTNSVAPASCAIPMPPSAEDHPAGKFYRYILLNTC